MKKLLITLGIIVVASVIVYTLRDDGSDLNVIQLSGNIELTQINVAFKTVPGAHDAAFGLDKANLS